MTQPETTPAYTQRFWAKSEPRRGHPKRIHLLEHHLADVGACLEALLRQPTIRRRLAKSGGRNDLDETTISRLSVLAALHDVGKVNVGFQSRIWRSEDLPKGERRLPGRAGHTLDLVPVLMQRDRRTAAWFFEALGWWWNATETWDDRGGETVCALLVATISHHGRPVQLEGGRAANPKVWQSFGQLDPKQFIERIGGLMKRWFRPAFGGTASHLPSSPEFQHQFLGLCNWADWIGSDERYFVYCDRPRDDYIHIARDRAKKAVSALGLDVSAQRQSQPASLDFRPLFPHVDGSPNAIQRTIHNISPHERLIIMESETGSGKTEAALWRFARIYNEGLVDGLYFALPTRAAAVQIHERVKRFVNNMFVENERPPVVLAVPGYSAGEDADGVAMPHYNPWWEHHSQDRIWATENPKRFLASQIAVGAVDQAMMGALQVKNAHMRAACLARNLLVVDEVHASDTYMSAVLKALLEAHVGAGGYALLMSATLGSVARHSWLNLRGQTTQNMPSLTEAIAAPYPSVSHLGMKGNHPIEAGSNDQEKTVRVETWPAMRDFKSVARRALSAARAGAKALVVRNTVDYAIRTQQALEAWAGAEETGLLFRVKGKATLSHGRFAAVDRKLLDNRVEELLGRGRGEDGRVVVGTQTLEQSLDIDADLLITDLCPADVLLQRIGRLHRHRDNDASRPDGYKKPACIVLTPEGGDLSPLLKRGADANGLGPHGGVYQDLRILEATRRLIVEHTEWRIPEMNRLLVEEATHPEALEAIVEELGDEWKAHGLEIQGEAIGDSLTARGVIIQRGKSFFTDNREVLFVSDEERIRTRLGDDRVDIAFQPPALSPFATSKDIEKLAMSVRWLGGEDATEPVVPTETDGGFAFAIGDRRFAYDRLGLRREG